MKITTRLAVSAAAFVLPIALMFFFIISVSLSAINRDGNELKGIGSLRLAGELMRLVPKYIEISVDEMPGSNDAMERDIAELIESLKAEYEKSFGAGTFPGSIGEDWRVIAGGRGALPLAAFETFMRDIHALTANIGDFSEIVTDPGLESSYLADAALNRIPAIQARIVYIGNLLRKLGDGGFSQADLDEFRRHETLLFFGDRPRAREVFDEIEAVRRRGGLAGVSDVFENPLAIYDNAMLYLSETLSKIGIRQVSDGMFGTNGRAAVAMGKSAIGNINDAAYRLQKVSLDRLENLIGDRIRAYRLRLVNSLLFSVAAALVAFSVSAAAALNIRRSTRTVNRVFGRLEKNDLSVALELSSRDELGEMLAGLDRFLEKLKAAFVSFTRNAEMVSTAVFDLSASAKEITTTANEQSASIAEIVSTMENSKNLSEQVASKTVDVADLAARTRELSRRGVELRDANEDMMLDIRDQNEKIIEEIKNLADMLSRIDEAVQLIDTIADQTKLIAFNAALEASSSGEAGARFAVVAGEIRRFADNVVESVAEIKDKISELQSASQSLITESNNGTRAIDTGYQRMVEQKEVFEGIVDISQNVATKSQQISNLSKQQELAISQIFTALKEISTGVRQFVTATASTSATADNLNAMSEELKETLAKYKTQ
jgi:methyl-accepting chemotaxis protein